MSSPNGNSATPDDRDRSVHLAASAGSGKTRALRNRYLSLLSVLYANGFSIDQTVAITFTDKAAAEIRERVMHGLTEPMLKEIIRGEHDLRISTIHSFCMNLLKRYPLDAGLPPDFSVLDARDQSPKLRMSVENALEAVDRDAGRPLEPLRLWPVERIIAATEFLLSLRSRLKRMEIDRGGPDGLLSSLRRGMRIDALTTELAALMSSPEWKSGLVRMERILRAGSDQYEQCRGNAHLLLSTEQDLDAAATLAHTLEPVYMTREGGPRKKPLLGIKLLPQGAHKEYSALYFDIQGMLFRFLDGFRCLQAGRETLGIARLYLASEERYRFSKMREGLLDFDDLEIFAYRLLQDAGSPEVLYWLDRKILHFLVDEFQDTSDIQWAIIERLTAEIFAGEGVDKGMRPTLFVVGDEKQSIYRFREANYRLMGTVRDRIERFLPPEHRLITTLDHNYRSASGVIAAVNDVFTGLWGDRYIASLPVRADLPGTVKVIEIMPGVREEVPVPTEAEVLAREIGAFVERGVLVADPEYPSTDPTGGITWKHRPAEYGDCAILLQSRTKLKLYEEALRNASIPFRVIGGIGFYEEDEIQAIINVLFHLGNRDDELSLAAALLSPLFRLSDTDLYEIARSDRPLAEGLQDHHPGIAGLLHDWKSLSGLVPLAALIHRIVQDTDAYVRFGSRNGQAVFNIDKLIDTAHEFDRRGYTTLQDFVEWVRNIRQSEQQVASADMNVPGSRGAVSILTVHKSKGLEFRALFLPGLNQYMRSLTHGPEAVVREQDGDIVFAMKGNSNPLYNALWKGSDGEQAELIREHQRLLYVAMTRARDHLVMIGELSTSKAALRANTWLDYLHRTVLKGAHQEEHAPGITEFAAPGWAPGEWNQIPEKPIAEREAVRPPVAVNPDVVSQNLAPSPRSESPVWTSVTALLEQEHEAITAGKANASPASLPPEIRGRILHRCLEDLTKSGSYDIDRIAGYYPVLASFEPAMQREVIESMRSVIDQISSNSDLSWVLAPTGAYSELPFLMRRKNEIVSGVIDRVIVQDDHVHVIDYKSDSIRDAEDLTEHAKRYHSQVGIYCEAAKGIFGASTAKGSILFLNIGKIVQII